MLDMPVKAGIFATEQMINLLMQVQYTSSCTCPRKFDSKWNSEVSCKSFVQLKLKAIKLAIIFH